MPSRLVRYATLAVAVAGALSGSAPGVMHVFAQTGAGSATGFVRINGSTLTLRHAYAVTAPDSFDPGQEVRLVLVTPTPLASESLAKASSRGAVFALVPLGAIIEVRAAGHDVFLFHKALGDQRLQTGGRSSFKPATADRVGGDVQTFMSGDEERFGFKVRYEIAFDAPIVKRLPLATPTAAAPAAAARPPAGPLPRTRAEAARWLAAQGLGNGPEGLGFYLTLGKGLSADVVRAYLLVGAAADRPLDATGDYPLSAVAIACDGQPGAAAAADVLLQAGANASLPEPTGRKATPAMAAVMCPELLQLILARKPDLNVVDANGLTAMHYAMSFGKPRDDVARMIQAAGFDMKRWRASLLDRFGGTDERRLIDALSGVTTAPAAAAAPARPPTAPTTTALDWKALGPYPVRSPAESARLLARPGADTSIDDHFWDGITRREPQRLAVAIQAGANVKQTRPASDLTPLMVLADRCEVDRDVDLQVEIARQLLAAGAEVATVHREGWTALMFGADDCPIDVVRLLVKAGSPMSIQTKDGNTALKLAILEGRADVVDALLDAGLDIRKEPYNVGRLASTNKAVEAALRKRRR